MAVLPMMRIVLRNLISKPATRRYPREKRESFALSRGRIDIDFPACVLCGACAKRCPAAAIEVSRERGLWRIDRLACVICGACVRVCPKKCLAMNPERPGVADAHRGGRPLFSEQGGRSEERRREIAAPRPASSADPAGAPDA